MSIASAARAELFLHRPLPLHRPPLLLLHGITLQARVWGYQLRDLSDHWRVLAVDLTGAFHTIRRATPKMMRARFGRIVNVSSVVAHVGGAGQANYGAAKAGLVGLSRSVARELGSRGITCNVVAPGPIEVVHAQVCNRLVMRA